MSTNARPSGNGFGYREEVLKELVLYVASKCWRDEHYGVLKLNKILFYSDFNAFKRRGRSITGAVYKKHEHGPAPEVMKRVRKELETREEAWEYESPVRGVDEDGEPFVEKRLLARRAAKLNEFLTAEEISIVDEVIEWLRPRTGAQVSLMSHRHAGWRFAKMDETIPYFTALIPDESAAASAATMAWVKTVAEKFASGAIAK